MALNSAARGAGGPGGPSAGQAASWRFSQSFGDDSSSEDDLVTAVAFAPGGRFLAVGDKAGRICIFKERAAGPPKGAARAAGPEYRFFTEFQSHEAEFDCLKSLEIEERISAVRWLPPVAGGVALLAANDKTVKLWRVHEKRVFEPCMPHGAGWHGADGAAGGAGGAAGELRLPPRSAGGRGSRVTTATQKRVYASGHQYHVHSVSVNSDSQTFISADDLRINLWSLEHESDCFNIVDLKPNNLEELSEVITSAAFHPKQCSILGYGTSRGAVRLGDLRDSALCDSHAKTFVVEQDPASKSFFSDIIASVSDVKFTGDGMHVLARDLLSLKLWDIRMESEPVVTVPVHEYLKTHLTDLYENNCIFDRFSCDASADGARFVTGSYDNNFIVSDLATRNSVTIAASRDAAAAAAAAGGSGGGAAAGHSSSFGGGGGAAAGPGGKRRGRGKGDAAAGAGGAAQQPNVNMIDFGKKALHVAWHPCGDTVAVAGLNRLYIYNASAQSAPDAERKQ